MARSLSQAFRRRVDAALSPQARQKIIADAAGRIIADAAARNAQAAGHAVPYKVMVDGRAGAPLTSVNPNGGHIVVRFELIADVLRWIDELLIKHSQPLTGHYAKSHVWLADGQLCELDHLPEAKAYQVLSTVPYARRIERGESSQAPSGVYEVVAVLAGQRFGNIGHVSFGYRSPLLDYVPGGKNRTERAAFRNLPARLSAMRMERATRVPAITIMVT